MVSCPGPQGPDFTCVGGRTGRCPLIDPADVIVFDQWLPGDELIMGTTPLELLSLYTTSGTPVVALGQSDFARDLYGEGPVAFLPRHPEVDELVRAVQGATEVPRREISDPARREEQ